MLTKLYLRNFKSFGDAIQELPLRRFTLIFGPNSSGKSSILQSILFFKQTMEKSSPKTLLISRGELVDVGNFRDFIHQHEYQRTLTIGFEFTNWMIDFFGMDSITPVSSLLLDYDFRSGYIQLSKYKGTSDMFTSYFEDLFSVPDFHAEVSGKFVSEEFVEYTDEQYFYYNNTIDKLVDFLFASTALKELLLEKIKNWDNAIDDVVSFLETDFIASNLQTLKIVDTEDKNDQIIMSSDGTIPALRTLFNNAMNNKFGAKNADKSLPFYHVKYIFPEVIEQNYFFLEKLIALIKQFKYQFFGKYATESIKATTISLLQNKFGTLVDLSNPLTYSEDGWDHEDNEIKLERVDYIFPELFLNALNAILLSNKKYTEEEEDLNDPVYVYSRDRFETMKNLLFSPVKLFQSIRDLLKETLQQTYFIGPIREKPEKFHYFSGNIIEYVGQSGEHMADALFSQPHLLNDINNKLDAIEFGYTIELTRNPEDEEVFSLDLIDTVLKTKVKLPEVGIGVSQVLPVIVQTYLSDKQTICIEQPELHLHPKMQANLAQFLIERMQEKQDVQFIVETHSEHIILRIQKLIRQKKCSADDISVIYINKEEEGSVAYVLELNEQGDFLTDWPGGFFEEAFNEVFD